MQIEKFLTKEKIQEYIDEKFSLDDIYNIVFSNVKLNPKNKKNDIKEIQSLISQYILNFSFVKPEDLIKSQNINPEKFCVNKYEVKAWQGSDKKWMNSISVNFEQDKKENQLNNLRDLILSDVRKTSPKKPKPKQKKPTKEENLYLIGISDVHFGKRSITSESFSDSKKRFNEAVESLISRIGNEKIDQIVFPFGNDFFNFDSKFNQTTSGTPQSNELDWADLFNECKKILINTIDTLLEIAPVNIISVYGNHDYHSAISMSHLLDAYYHNDQRITTDLSKNQRKYLTWGSNLFGFSHGEKEKAASLPNLMAIEASKYWSSSKFRTMFIGHFHKKAEERFKTSDEECGVRLKVLSSLSYTDEWHDGKGYIGNIPCAEGMVYSKKEGLKTTHEVNFVK